MGNAVGPLSSRRRGRAASRPLTCSAMFYNCGVSCGKAQEVPDDPGRHPAQLTGAWALEDEADIGLTAVGRMLRTSNLLNIKS